MRQRVFAVALAAAAIVLAACSASPSGSGGRTTPSGATSGTASLGDSVSPPPVSDRYGLPESAAAKKIRGVVYKVEPDHTHLPGVLTYDTTPPTGGNHSQYWADCAGAVYPKAIANENAVHMLEHGAVWITYNAKTLPADQLAVLTKLVSGVDQMALSPYPALKTPISLQSWGYQLFVDNAHDPRIQQFIGALRYNPAVTPEYGAPCSQPLFLQHPSTFGHPLWLPAG